MKKLLLLIILLVCITLTASAADTGKWIYSSLINPINDKVVITFKLECEKNELEEPIFLILRKEGEGTTICIDWGIGVGLSHETVSARTKFGDNKAKRSWRWSISDTTFEDIFSLVILGKQRKVISQYTFYSGRKSKFIRKLMDVDRFVVEIKAMDRKLTAVFDVQGLKNAVEQFNDILGWIKE